LRRKEKRPDKKVITKKNRFALSIAEIKMNLYVGLKTSNVPYGTTHI
jgi:hypothetical protein